MRISFMAMEADMRSPLRHETDGPKRTANLSINEGLFVEAKELDVDVSHAAELGIAKAVAEKRAEQWFRENKAALESSNEYVERYGLPLGRYRQF